MEKFDIDIFNAPESNNDLTWMQYAYNLALKAQQQGEVPVGAVIVMNNEIIGEGWNRPINDYDPTAHAEIIALRDASKKIKNYRLVDSTMYVTLEPCVMCAGAIVHARLKRLVFATTDLRTGAAGSVFSILDSDQLNHKVDVTKGILAIESADLLKKFFKGKRETNK